MKRNNGMNPVNNDNGRVRWPKSLRKSSFLEFLNRLEKDPLFDKFYNSNFVEQPQMQVQPQQQSRAAQKPKTSSLKESLNKQIISGNGYTLQKMVLDKDWTKLKFILTDNYELCKWLAGKSFDWFFDLPSDILEIINGQL